MCWLQARGAESPLLEPSLGALERQVGPHRRPAFTFSTTPRLDFPAVWAAVWVTWNVFIVCFFLEVGGMWKVGKPRACGLAPERYTRQLVGHCLCRGRFVALALAPRTAPGHRRDSVKVGGRPVIGWVDGGFGHCGQWAWRRAGEQRGVGGGTLRGRFFQTLVKPTGLSRAGGTTSKPWST